MKRMLVAGTLIIAILASAWFLSRSTSFQLFGELVDRADVEAPLVALTFDDGPTARHTGPILDTLEALGVRATFFLVGEAMSRHPELTERIVEAGHQVGNHSYTHRRMWLMSADAMRSELDRADALIRRAGYRDDIVFRPPYGKKLLVLPWVLRARGTRTITWDVAPESGLGPDPATEDLVAAVLNDTRPGSIVLLHVMFDSRAASMAAVPPIVTGLRARGFRFVTVGELLAAENQRGRP